MISGVFESTSLVDALAEAAFSVMDPPEDEVTVRPSRASADPAHRIQRSQEPARRAQAREAQVRAAGEKSDATGLLLDRIRPVFADGRQRSVGDVCQALGTRNWAQMTTMLNTLVAKLELVRFMDAAKPYYRRATAEDLAARPPARSIEVPVFDATAFRQKLESILDTGVSYDLNEIVRNLRTKWPQVDGVTVSDALVDLRASGKVERIALGSFIRWRKLTTPAQELR